MVMPSTLRAALERITWPLRFSKAKTQSGIKKGTTFRAYSIGHY
jgi:hypothetical protein